MPMGHQLPAVQHKQLCDLQLPGHNRVIEPGKAAWVITEGIAQGKYHGPRCFQSAVAHYKQLQEQTGIKNELE